MIEVRCRECGSLLGVIKRPPGEYYCKVFIRRGRKGFKVQYRTFEDSMKLFREGRCPFCGHEFSKPQIAEVKVRCA